MQLWQIFKGFKLFILVRGEDSSELCTPTPPTFEVQILGLLLKLVYLPMTAQHLAALTCPASCKPKVYLTQGGLLIVSHPSLTSTPPPIKSSTTQFFLTPPNNRPLLSTVSPICGD